MLRFILIDDIKCKKELEIFIKKHSKSIKVLMLDKEVEKKLLRIRETLNKPSFNDKIAIKTRDGIQLLNTKEVMYCKGTSSQTKIVLKNKEAIAIAESLNKYEKRLMQCSFIRIHQHYLVNLDCIVKYTKFKGGYLELTDGTKLPVATRKKENLLIEINK